MSDKRVVKMLNRKGEDAGTATFTEVDDGVKLAVDFHGLPEGVLAMHVHETGAATPPDFKDADSHFNPTGAKHGMHSEGGPHLGDLPNIEVPASGQFKGEYLLKDVTMERDAKNSLNRKQGTALIVHEGKDDYVSQPTGAAGGRQLGGVIFPKED